jgi:mannose/cellobiose epimerase-like protein (N-acyl-D-glucosamine 2-epimerase family)
MAAQEYRSPDRLQEHLRSVLSFYHPTCIDDRDGGYVAQLDERDGHVYDSRSKHLVATARLVHNYSVGLLYDGPGWCRPAAEHGLSFLAGAHWDETAEGYDWLLEGRETVDGTRHCYGHAFVVLAGARAAQAGIEGGRATLERAARVMDERFWEPSTGLYADEASADWTDLSGYRGLNANMHACEALLAAGQATDEPHYLERAATIADQVTRGLADDRGRLWEHYTERWTPDMEYNRETPAHTFRPWGYQPGHHAEWAKLLGVLYEHEGSEWALERAGELFETALEMGWDETHGGLFYTVDRDDEPVVADKYSWPVTEALGAAAVLSAHESTHLEWYDRLWEYAYRHFVNPRGGNWYGRLTREHDRDGPGHGVTVEPGYHPINNVALAIDRFAG